MNNKIDPRAPDFLIIGAGKSGTTSLTNYLNQHPDIYMSGVREPNFFAYEGQQGISKISNWDDYLDTFSGATPGQILGEASPMYMFVPEAPVRIKKYIPNTKIIAVLRHPADRLYSRYMQLIRQDEEPSKSFADAFDKNSVWWQRADLIPEGFYYTHLKRYFELFDHANIRIFLYEEFEKNPAQLYKEICKFINVDTDFSPDLNIRLNQSGNIKNRWVDKIFGQKSPIKHYLKSRYPQAFNKLKSNPTTIRKLNQIRGLNLDKPELSHDFRNRLIEDVYKDEILALQGLIGRDFSTWLRTSP